MIARLAGAQNQSSAACFFVFLLLKKSRLVVKGGDGGGSELSEGCAKIWEEERRTFALRERRKSQEEGKARILTREKRTPRNEGAPRKPTSADFNLFAVEVRAANKLKNKARMSETRRGGGTDTKAPIFGRRVVESHGEGWSEYNIWAAMTRNSKLSMKSKPPWDPEVLRSK